MEPADQAASPGDEEIRTLLVDPDRAFAELAATFLERQDPRLSVDVAPNADQAIERVHDGNYDCVVAADGLPDRTGTELCQALDGHPGDMPCILLAGGEGTDVDGEDTPASVAAILPKRAEGYADLAQRVLVETDGRVSAQFSGIDHAAVRELVEIFPHPVYIIDEAGTVVLCNRALAALHGMSPEEMEGMHARAYLEPDVADQLLADIESVLDGDASSLHVEREVHDGEGNTRWIEGRLVEYHLPDDTRAVLGTSIDLTHRERRERELEDVRARQEAAIEAGAIGTWEWDIEADEIVTNPAFARVFGVDPSAAEEGAPLEEYLEAIHPEDRDRVAAAIEEAVEARDEYYAEYRVQGADGTLRWVSARGHVEAGEDERPVFRGAVTEITDRKERERRLEALNRHNSDMVGAESPEEVLQFGVDAAADILELDVNGIFRHDPDRAALVPEVVSDQAAILMEEMPTFPVEGSIAGRVFRTKEPAVIDDVREDPDLYNPDTASRSELHLPLDAYGVLVAGVAEVDAFDREDRVLGELLARNIVAALDQVYRTQELEARERELAEQYQRLDEFTSVVSHDLRNPLNVAIGRLELLQEDRESKHIGEIARALDRMKSLIDHLLTVAQGDERVETTEAVELDRLAETCWGFVPTAEASLEVEAELTIAGDRTRLRQLFENLFRNAIEHGGGDVRVRVGRLEDGFFVADDGPGIPEEDAEEIFRAGYSGGGTTGYGLAIVKQVAEAHDWTVTAVESDAGGARFEFRGIASADAAG